jgi:hypothetical protein
MEKSTFVFYGSFPSQGKVNWRNNVASEDRRVSQMCVIKWAL